MANKILLKIVPKRQIYPNFSAKFLEQYVRKMKLIANKGKVSEVTRYDGFRVFIWTFKKCIPCSDTRPHNFMFKTLVQNSEMPDSKTEGKISYPYFTLEQDMELDVVDMYIVAPEKDRVNAFSKSLQRNGYIVLQAGGDLSHYCEFSGGGDIYIENEMEEPFIFQSIQLTDEVDENGEAEIQTNSSPIKVGTHKLASLSIEAKRGTLRNIESMVSQLWANMMVLCVEKFVKSCDQSYKKNCKKEELISCKTLTGYGILCCGDGSMGGYKLEIDFNDKNTMIEKVKATTYSRTMASKWIDHMLEYFDKKTNLTKWPVST